MGNDLSILDEDAALASTGGDVKLGQLLQETCVEESPKLIRAARDAVAKDDFTSARRCGHSLKSSFGVVGAAVAASHSEKLEFIDSDDVEAFRQAIDSIDVAFRQLTDRINS